MQFVLEKLAVPRWLKSMQGFVKGKPWQRWTGPAREAGRVRMQQFKTREAVAEREGLGSQGASRKRVLGRTIDKTTGDIRERLAKIKDPRYRKLLTQSNKWADPLLKTELQTRLPKIKQMRQVLPNMSFREAGRSVAGIGKPLPPGRAAKEQAAYMRMAPAHMVPPPGQTGSFYSMMHSAPTALQPRFKAVEQQILARRAAQANLANLGGAKIVRPGGAFAPTHRLSGDFI